MSSPSLKIPEKILLAPIGKKAPSPALDAITKLVGEKPKTLENEIVFVKTGLAYYRAERGGPLESVFWPAKAGGPTSVALPRDLDAKMGDGDVRALIGEPSHTPDLDFYMETFPQDIFDWPDITLQVAYDAKASRIRGVCMSTAKANAQNRYLRSVSSRPIRNAKAARGQSAAGRASPFEALLDQMRKAKRRRRPLPEALAWMKRGVPKDLQAFLEAHALHAHGAIDLGEYRLTDDVLDDDVPKPGSTRATWRIRTDRVCIGRTGGGDLWVVAAASKGRSTRVFRVHHDDDWSETPAAPSLEAFFAARATDA